MSRSTRRHNVRDGRRGAPEVEELPEEEHGEHERGEQDAAVVLEHRASGEGARDAEGGGGGGGGEEGVRRLIMRATSLRLGRGGRSARRGSRENARRAGVPASSTTVCCSHVRGDQFVPGPPRAHRFPPGSIITDNSRGRFEAASALCGSSAAIRVLFEPGRFSLEPPITPGCRVYRPYVIAFSKMGRSTRLLSARARVGCLVDAAV